MGVCVVLKTRQAGPELDPFLDTFRPVQFDRKSHRKIGNRKSNFTDLDEKIYMYG